MLFSRIGLALSLMAAAAISGCGGGEPTPTPAPSAGTPAASAAPDFGLLTALLNRGVRLTDRHEFEQAAAAFEEALKLDASHAAIWIDLGIAAMNAQTDPLTARAETAFKEALVLEPANPWANHAYGILLNTAGRVDEAKSRFAAVLAADPHDAVANFYYAAVLLDAGDTALAEKHLRAALTSEPHLSSAMYRLAQVLAAGGEDTAETRRKLLEEFRALTDSGAGTAASVKYTEMGKYGEAIRVFPFLGAAASAPRPQSFALSQPLSEIQPAGPARMASVAIPAGIPPAEVLRGPFAQAFGPGAALADIDNDGDLDLYAADGVSAGVLWLNEKGMLARAAGRRALPAVAGAISISGCFGDADNDGHVDLYIACAGPNVYLRNTGTGWEDRTATGNASGGNRFTSQAVWADLDTDGDLDLYLANLADLDAPHADAARAWPADFPGCTNLLLSNDREGVFSDITERTRTGGSGRSVGVVSSDLDGDHDADLLVLNLGSPNVLLRNDRIWRWADVSAGSGVDALADAIGAIPADLSGDGLPDLTVVASSAVHGLTNLGAMRFAAPVLREAGNTACLLDAGNDGSLDLATPGLLTLASGEKFAIPTGDAAGLRTLLAADLNGDGALDLVASRSGRDPLVLRGSINGEHTWLGVSLEGKREAGKSRANTGGVGAAIEVAAGRRRQTFEAVTSAGVLGGPSQRIHVGLAGAPEADYVRVTWPDDVVQSEGQLSARQIHVIREVQRKSSSCPLLFAWDGERHAFVTDFLGTGGMGFFIAPGVYAPPDPTEIVRIPQLAARNGYWELIIHEAMEEILYLDQAVLRVVDHLPGTEVYPNERLAVYGPPQDGRTITVRSAEKMYPRALATTDGPADPELLAREDRRYQPGVVPDPRFLGYAKPQTIDLDFGPVRRSWPAGASERTPARPLFLFVNGWVEYPYSYINFAAWQQGLSFDAMSIDVEVADRKWVTLHEQFGYPAGMPRVMTLDISSVPADWTGRIRLRTNIELYVDEVFIAEDIGLDAGTVQTDLPPATSLLRRSGYPREYSPDGRLPLLYDYHLMDPAIDYKTMAGGYTRFGDVRPLLGEADDMYVVMGRAEEIVARYPVFAAAEDRQRTFFLVSDGWCKDMDPYTAYPYTVDPLPFHAMSGFPYPPSERAPDTQDHRRWIAEYQTRILSGSRAR